MSDELNIPSPTYRVPRRSAIDPGTKRLAIIAAGLGGTLLAVVGASAVSSHRSGHVPVIEPDRRPIRIKPENPGGLQVLGAGDEILSGDATTGEGKLLPPPEIPAPQDLKNPPPVRAPAVAPAVATPGPMAAQKASLTPAAAAEPRAPLAAGAEAKSPPKPAAPAAPSAKGSQVQLAAFENEQAARSEWERLAKRMPDILAGKQPAVVKAERDGKTIWRLRTGGFSDSAQATAFCERVRAKGASCSVASF